MHDFVSAQALPPSTIGSLLSLVWRQTDRLLRVCVFSTMLLTLAMASLNATAPLLYKNLVDWFAKADAARSLEFPLKLVAAYLAMVVISRACAELRWALYGGFEQRVQHRLLLRGVSFSVPQGRTVAIAGPSGAGKSTIARLAFRFYDACSGRITVNGAPIEAFTLKSLRAAIAVVPQDTVLFNDTIAHNIGIARDGCSASDIEGAARTAEIHDFILALPDGYQTVVGERGLKLSGGQKQRVAIARAVLKRASLLIFDEATSALDSETEHAIQRNLRSAFGGITTLIITHRLSTIIDADEIVVLNEGCVVERGRHGELLSLAGLYADMWRRQQEENRQEVAAV
jgi:ATP-binding cassette, subfamily B, heavy metal transporter